MSQMSKGKAERGMMDPKEAALRRQFHAYRCSARKRHLSFDLDLSDLGKITSLPCHYCGAAPEVYSGIDRVDNSRGYVFGNMVPCCWKCNQMKGKLSEEVFLAQAYLIATRNIGRLRRTPPPEKSGRIAKVQGLFQVSSPSKVKSERAKRG